MLAYKLLYTGLNYARFFNLCMKYGICLYDIESIDSTHFSFSVSSRDYYKFKSIEAFHSFDISILKNGGIRAIRGFMLDRIGLIIGVIVGFILISYMSTLTCFIFINNTSADNEALVYKALSDYGIKMYRQNDIDTDDLEIYLLEKVSSISMVSVRHTGSSIIINIKDTEYSDTEAYQYQPIIANYDMLITSIEVYAGTSNVKAQDIVRKGDVLVEPYTTDSDGNKVYMEPKAKIQADVWFSDSMVYNPMSTDKIKTGKSKLIGYSVYFRDNKIYEYKSDINYTEYIIDDIEYTFSDMYIPIKVVKTMAYEIRIVNTQHDFDSDKDNIIDNLTQNTYKTIPQGMEVSDTQVQISQNNGKYYIVVYLKCSIIVE